MATPHLEIIVIGAGLSGLTAAIACALAGHQIIVLEAARELAEIGAGLQITPNGSRIFKQLGVYNILEAKAAEPTFLQVRRYSDGKILSRTASFNIEMKKKYGSPFWDLHRVDVQIALVNRAKELGVKVRLGAKVPMDYGPAVESVSTATTGNQTRLSQRVISLIVSYSNSKDLADQELRDWISNPSCQFWIGPSSHVVAYSLRNGTVFNLVLLVPDDLPANVARQPGSLDEMRQLFSNWDPVLNRFLDQVKSVDKWKLMHRAELDRWISEKSNLVFIGDSCHPMLPYLAQGANSSLEDGAVLGYILAALESKEQLPSALNLYEHLRKERGETIARESFAQRQDFHLRDGPEQQSRDELMLSRLGKEIDCKFPSRWQCPQVQPWLFGYDAKQETENALQEWPLSGREGS